MEKRKVVKMTLRLAPAERAKRSVEKTGKERKNRILPMHKGKLLCLTALACLQTACAGTALSGDEFRLSGTPEGIQAFSDWQVGVQNEARTPEGVKGSHYQLRERQTVIRFAPKNKGAK